MTFDEEFSYTQAKIRMSNPRFFGVTMEDAVKYSKIIQKREQNLYSPDDLEASVVSEDDIIDVDYKEEPRMTSSCKSYLF